MRFICIYIKKIIRPYYNKKMAIKQEAFRAYHEEKVRDSFTVNVNKEERRLLDQGKDFLNNSMDSTVLKKLAWIGLNEIQSKKTKAMLEIILDERRKAKQRGELL